MPATAVRTCLIDLTPEDWYALINSRVFVWFDRARLNRQRVACGTRPQVVLTIDVAKPVADYGDQAFVSLINTDNARRRAARRGQATFVPYATWLQSGWTSEAAALRTTERQKSHPPAELTIAGSIPDIARYMVTTTHLAANEAFEPRSGRSAPIPGLAASETADVWPTAADGPALSSRGETMTTQPPQT